MTRVYSFTLLGSEARPVEIEVDVLGLPSSSKADVLGGLPSISIVGMPASAVRETATRVRSAIQATGFEMPKQRIVVTIRSEGESILSGFPTTHLDLPIAVGILRDSGQIGTAWDGPPSGAPLHDKLFAGELSLGGDLRPFRGAVSFGELSRRGWQLGTQTAVCPRSEAGLVAFGAGSPVIGLEKLSDLRDEIWHGQPASQKISSDLTAPDYADVQASPELTRALRGLQIAAVLGLNVLLVGPPGCGKTMLARRFGTLLPPLTGDESRLVTQIYNNAGLAPEVVSQRPFRAPHYTATGSGLIGDMTRPGETSLAHHGVLFLDEAPEFSGATLELLGAVIRQGESVISRHERRAHHPARFTLIAAANPCPCGNFNTKLPCRCTAQERVRYLRRLKGLLPFIDVVLELSVPQGIGGQMAPTSATLRAEVIAAQGRVQHGSKPVLSAEPEPRSLAAASRIAQAIRLLEGAPDITSAHLAEALTFSAPAWWEREVLAKEGELVDVIRECNESMSGKVTFTTVEVSQPEMREKLIEQESDPDFFGSWETKGDRIFYPETGSTAEKMGLCLEWEHIGEGYGGDWDPEDPEDKPLLRANLIQKQDGKTEVLHSYCTLAPTDTAYSKLHHLSNDLFKSLEDTTVSQKHSMQIWTHSTGQYPPN